MPMRPETIAAMKEHTEARTALGAVMGSLSMLSPEDRAAIDRCNAADRALSDALAVEQEDAEARIREPEVADALRGLDLSDYVHAAMRGKAVEGRAAEINAELGLDGNQAPWAILLDDEDRADAITTVPAAAKGKPRQSIIPRVFRRSDAAFLGVTMPTAPRGFPIYPVLTGGVAPGTVAAGAAVDATAATFTSTMISPTRATANYIIRAEEAVTFEGLEATLRADLRAAMNVLLDDAVVSRDATSPNPGSIISHADATGVTDPSAVATLANFDSAWIDGIDGLYAYGRSDSRVLIGTDTEKYIQGKRHDETAQTWAQLLESTGSPRRASSRVPAVASTIQKAYRVVPNELRAIAPIWDGLTFIRDPYTRATRAEVRITATMLFGFDIVRGTVQELRFKIAT